MKSSDWMIGVFVATLDSIRQSENIYDIKKIAIIAQESYRKWERDNPDDKGKMEC